MSVFPFFPSEDAEKAVVALLEAGFAKAGTQWGLNGFRSAWLVDDDDWVELLAVEEPRLRVLFLDVEEPQPLKDLLSEHVDEMSLDEVIEHARKGTERIAFSRLAAFLAPDDPSVESLLLEEFDHEESWRVVSAIQAAAHIESAALQRAVSTLEDDERLSVAASAERARLNRQDQVEFVTDRVLVDIEAGPPEVVNALQDEITAIAFQLGLTFELVKHLETRDETILAWESANNELLRIEYRHQPVPLNVWVRLVSTSKTQNRLMRQVICGNEVFLSTSEGIERCAQSSDWASWVPSLASVADDESRGTIRELVSRGLSSDSWRARIDSAWAVAALDDDESYTLLRGALERETNDEVRVAMERLLPA
jgi:hypothetical protein